MNIPPVKRQYGFGMIEILITILVLSVGLLGVAALQGFSLQTSQMSYERTQATNIVYELIDHMRAYRSRVLATDTVPGLNDWQARVASVLPGANLRVCPPNNNCFTGVPDDHYCRQLGDGDGLRVTVTVDLVDEQRLDENAAQGARWLFCVSSKI